MFNFLCSVDKKQKTASTTNSKKSVKPSATAAAIPIKVFI